MAANDTRKGLPQQITRNSKTGFLLKKSLNDSDSSLYTRHLLQALQAYINEQKASIAPVAIAGWVPMAAAQPRLEAWGATRHPN
jgi:hypothetical protein